jgi:hypothetical protein
MMGGNNLTCSRGRSSFDRPGSSSCLPATLDPYAVGGSGLRLLQAAYNRSAARWDIDVSFVRDPDATTIVALYLPRAMRGSDGSFTADFNSSFEPRSFPCSTANLSSRAATICCLADFSARYHVVSTFTLQATTNLFRPIVSNNSCSYCIVSISSFQIGVWKEEAPALFDQIPQPLSDQHHPGEPSHLSDNRPT